MPTYALLLLPSANRVYGAHANELALAELDVVSRALHAPPDDPALTTIGGLDYVTFGLEHLDDHDRFVLSNLSSVYAMFRAHDSGALEPVEVHRLAHFPTDLITIQRFSGKTNEQFTHLLVNVAVAASTAAAERSEQSLPVRVLDPTAGRGTTLNRALMYGYDAVGIEISASDVEAYRTFITTYLKNNRRSFKLQEESPRKGPLAGTKRFTLRLGTGVRVEVVRGDTVDADRYFAARSFDVLVADLPYGVQHRAATATAAAARSPLDLVTASLPAWRQLLRGGASLALAWNLKTMRRADLEAAVEAQGLTLVRTDRSFEHGVDRAVTRDVLLATA